MEKNILLRLDKNLYTELSDFFEESTFSSQTELIRQAIREYIQRSRAQRIVMKHFHAYSGRRPTREERAKVADEFIRNMAK